MGVTDGVLPRRQCCCGCMFWRLWSWVVMSTACVAVAFRCCCQLHFGGSSVSGAQAVSDLLSSLSKGFSLPGKTWHYLHGCAQDSGVSVMWCETLV
jgi:hypothetical protein